MSGSLSPVQQVEGGGNGSPIVNGNSDDAPDGNGRPNNMTIDNTGRLIALHVDTLLPVHENFLGMRVDTSLSRAEGLDEMKSFWDRAVSPRSRLIVDNDAQIPTPTGSITGELAKIIFILKNVSEEPGAQELSGQALKLFENLVSIGTETSGRNDSVTKGMQEVSKCVMGVAVNAQVGIKAAKKLASAMKDCNPAKARQEMGAVIKTQASGVGSSDSTSLGNLGDGVESTFALCHGRHVKMLFGQNFSGLGLGGRDMTKSAQGDRSRVLVGASVVVALAKRVGELLLFATHEELLEEAKDCHSNVELQYVTVEEGRTTYSDTPGENTRPQFKVIYDPRLELALQQRSVMQSRVAALLFEVLGDEAKTNVQLRHVIDMLRTEEAVQPLCEKTMCLLSDLDKLDVGLALMAGKANGAVVVEYMYQRLQAAFQSRSTHDSFAVNARLLEAAVPKKGDNAIEHWRSLVELANSRKPAFPAGVLPDHFYAYLSGQPQDTGKTHDCVSRQVVFQMFTHCDNSIVQQFLVPLFGNILENPALLGRLTHQFVSEQFEKLLVNGVGRGRTLDFVTGESMSASSGSSNSKKEVKRKQEAASSSSSAVGGPGNALSAVSSASSKKGKKAPIPQGGKKSAPISADNKATFMVVKKFFDAMKAETKVEAQDAIVAKFLEGVMPLEASDSLNGWCTGKLAVGEDFFKDGQDWAGLFSLEMSDRVKKLMFFLMDVVRGPNPNLKKPYCGYDGGAEIADRWRRKSPLAKHIASLAPASAPKSSKKKVKPSAADEALLASFDF